MKQQYHDALQEAIEYLRVQNEKKESQKKTQVFFFSFF